MTGRSIKLARLSTTSNWSQLWKLAKLFNLLNKKLSILKAKTQHISPLYVRR